MRPQVSFRIFCAMTLMLLAFKPGRPFLVDDDSSSLTSSFQLTFTPSVIKRGITTNVSLLCEHGGQRLSQLGEVSRIRIMKQSGSDWDLLVQKKIANSTSINDINISVMGKVSQNVNDTYLEVSWAQASEDTFGTYRCDVIGLDRKLNTHMESTGQVKVLEQPVTTNDLLTLLLQTRKEITEMTKDTNRHLDILDREIAGLKDQALTQDSVAAWPEGDFALLQPRSGCPVDLTFLGGDASYFVIHTESSSDSKNQNLYSKGMPLSTVTKLGPSAQLFTLRFCEAKRAFNTNRWPRGSYCINKMPGKPCPSGFDEGSAILDAEDTNTTTDLRGSVITEFGDRAKLEFCCRNSGSSRYKMHLPTHSPFILYRKGGTCQPIYGMKVSEENIVIDTEDSNNGDEFVGALPDVYLVGQTAKPVRFALCYYTKL